MLSTTEFFRTRPKPLLRGRVRRRSSSCASSVGCRSKRQQAVLEVSERTVKREWQKPRVFLFDALRQQGLG
jgi:hypothetical protein